MKTKLTKTELSQIANAPGIVIHYSRVNQAWLVMWGNPGAKLEELQVLRVFNAKEEAFDYIDNLAPKKEVKQ